MFDTLLVNARIYSMEHENERFEAMGIDKGSIQRLYESEPKNPTSLAKKIIDMEGKYILPGLIDGHLHFMSTAALQEMALNVSEIKNGKMLPDSIDGVKEKIQAFAQVSDPKKPIFCFNYVIAATKENRLPYAREIDEWIPNRIVMILSMDAHSSSYSTSALKLLGFDPLKTDGILVGEDHEYNAGKITDILMKYLDIHTITNGLQHLVNDAIKHGIVGINCLDGFEGTKRDVSLWFLSKFGGKLPLYLRLFPQLRDVERVCEYFKVMQYPRIGGCGGWEMDGSIGSHTAAFNESFADQPTNFGKLLFPYDELRKCATIAQKSGCQITSHAIGTKGIERILQAFEELKKSESNDAPAINRSRIANASVSPLSNSIFNKATQNNIFRHRIDHFEFPTADQVERAIDKLGLLITAQPGYAWIDELYQKAYRKYLRPEQFQRQIPLKTIVEKGGCIIGSSDSPVQHLNPFIQISGMVNFPLENQRISVYEAIRTYTYNAAYSTFEEQTRGTLSIGKNADFIIMNQDPFHTPKEQIGELKVNACYIQGKKMEPMNSGSLKFILGSLIMTKKLI
jgi:predicted amidohydrolase YtcJ